MVTHLVIVELLYRLLVPFASPPFWAATLRLAQGQIWPVLADRSDGTGQDVAGQGSREIEQGHESHAANAQARHQNSQGRVCGEVIGANSHGANQAETQDN